MPDKIHVKDTPQEGNVLRTLDLINKLRAQGLTNADIISLVKDGASATDLAELAK